MWKLCKYNFNNIGQFETVKLTSPRTSKLILTEGTTINYLYVASEWQLLHLCSRQINHIRWKEEPVTCSKFSFSFYEPNKLLQSKRVIKFLGDI